MKKPYLLFLWKREPRGDGSKFSPLFEKLNATLFHGCTYFRQITLATGYLQTIIFHIQKFFHNQVKPWSLYKTRRAIFPIKMVLHAFKVHVFILTRQVFWERESGFVQ